MDVVGGADGEDKRGVSSGFEEFEAEAEPAADDETTFEAKERMGGQRYAT